MRSNPIPAFLVAAILGASSVMAACTANIDEINLAVDDPTVTFNTDVDVDNVEQGQSVPVEINADNVFLIDPDETPPPEKADAAGHLQFYFDDVNSTPILITAETSVS